MGVLVAILALIVLAAIIGAGAFWYSQQQPPEPAPAEADLAAPYREGLHAAMRMQTVAQDLERQMYDEAIRRANEGPGGEP